ncbi:hypothetical protein COCMIDRAFT_93168 [Bipolaris oryzae ATCC 44560]|uniref:Uncharacterized protein n=1 Tax=Bipolaris oryzae ATCC 44560 TaxID=930090 RepID=W6ZRK9_COCMI|nr:uncharacterized protein COCMIDRAFT_93168 [Bipolaris oryzae ATCC 44560]EUC46341.1 hypothetical protein COCMIDRAFT_93168 [Bipolaris oryzae ATCC 44560]
MHEKEQSSPWLAIRFGCCASKEDVIDESRDSIRDIETDMRICYEQPRAVPQPCAEPIHARPSTSQSVSRHVSQWVSNSREYATRASSRTSISTLARPSRSRARPSISRPSNFRHFDGLDDFPSMLDDASMPVRRRRSFRPLELSIYLPNGCGRLSPLPNFGDEEYWSNLPSQLSRPQEAHVRVRDSRTSSVSSEPSSSSYLVQRKPVRANSGRTSVQSQHSTVTHERRLSGTTMGTMATPTLAFLSEDSPLPDNQVPDQPPIRRSRTSGTLSPARVLSRLPSPSRARANTAPSRPGSIRRTKTDVDDAIRELNTIVEERRASAYRSQTQTPSLINRPPPSPSHHVPYLAPSMRMHVRSETLSDIGSAFSAPLSSKALPTTPEPARRTTLGLSLAVPPRLHTGPLTSNPPTPPPAATPTTPIARLGAWLKRSTSSLASSATSLPTTPKTAASFYKCETTRPSLPSFTSSANLSDRTLHTRQDSHGSTDTTATTATLLPTRPESPVSSIATTSPPRKLRRVPAPLILVEDKEIQIEKVVVTPGTASTRGAGRGWNATPPMSPNRDLLKGMEIVAKDVGVGGGGRWSRRSFLRREGAVGVAF